MDQDTTLLSAAKVAILLGCSVGHVTEVLARNPGFPKPVTAGYREWTRWSEAAVLRWMEGLDRAINGAGARRGEQAGIRRGA